MAMSRAWSREGALGTVYADMVYCCTVHVNFPGNGRGDACPAWDSPFRKKRLFRSPRARTFATHPLSPRVLIRFSSFSAHENSPPSTSPLFFLNTFLLSRALTQCKHRHCFRCGTHLQLSCLALPLSFSSLNAPLCRAYGWASVVKYATLGKAYLFTYLHIREFRRF